MKTLSPPKDLRKGQALFVFLAWLGQEKRANALSAKITIDTHGFDLDGHFQLGDPFHIADDRLEALWEEWKAEVETSR